MYAQPNNTALTNPLRQWLPTYTDDYKWAWQFHEPTGKLHHHHQHVWYEYTNLWHQPATITYWTKCQTRANIPVGTLPVTPQLKKNSICIALLITQTQANAPAAPIPAQTLYQCMMEPPTMWDSLLWDLVCCHELIATLRGAIQEGQPITIISDASVNHQNYGACALAIWSQQLLWSSEGRVPSNQNNIYSGLAKVFGIYQSLQVLYYINQYPLIYHHNAQAAVYCDNQGVIECISRAPIDPQPCNMICDNYPIIQAIHHIRLQLQPIWLTFHHIDGHLNTWKSKCPLTIAETLNIECDQQATQYSQIYPPLAMNTNLLMEHSYPHLCIKNQVIHQQMQHSLHDASTKTEYYQYLREKFNWDNEHIQEIHWPSVNQAIQWLTTKPECRIISKFIHKWLPLETQYHMQSTSALQHCHIQYQVSQNFSSKLVVIQMYMIAKLYKSMKCLQHLYWMMWHTQYHSTTTVLPWYWWLIIEKKLLEMVSIYLPRQAVTDDIVDV